MIVLVGAHDAGGDIHSLPLGQVAGGDFRCQRPPDAAARLMGVGQGRGRPRGVAPERFIAPPNFTSPGGGQQVGYEPVQFFGCAGVAQRIAGQRLARGGQAELPVEQRHVHVIERQAEHHQPAASAETRAAATRARPLFSDSRRALPARATIRRTPIAASIPGPSAAERLRSSFTRRSGPAHAIWSRRIPRISLRTCRRWSPRTSTWLSSRWPAKRSSLGRAHST